MRMVREEFAALLRMRRCKAHGDAYAVESHRCAGYGILAPEHAAVSCLSS